MPRTSWPGRGLGMSMSMHMGVREGVHAASTSRGQPRPGWSRRVRLTTHAKVLQGLGRNKDRIRYDKIR